MAKVNVSLPDGLLADVDDLASQLHRSRSGLVQEATARYVAQLRDERAALERENGIREAMAGMRETARSIAKGPDPTMLIRADRDADYGSGNADE